MVDVAQWAEIRRMHRVERLPIDQMSKPTGLQRTTIRRALAAELPPKYARASARSKLDPSQEWICAQLRADPDLQSPRLREMASELGHDGAKTIFETSMSTRCGQARGGPDVSAHGLPAGRAGAVCG